MNKTYSDALEIYREIFSLLGGERNWVHYNQTFRAAASVVANIAEGEGSDWGRHGYMLARGINARGSLYENLAWLDIALVEKLVEQKEVEEIRINLANLDVVLKKQLVDISDERASSPSLAVARKATNQEYWAEKAKERKEAK